MSTKGELKGLIETLRDLADKIEKAVDDGMLKTTERTYIEMYDGDNGKLIRKTRMTKIDPTPNDVERSKKAMIQNNIRKYVIYNCRPDGGWNSLGADKWTRIAKTCKEKIKNLRWKVYEGDGGEND